MITERNLLDCRPLFLDSIHLWRPKMAEKSKWRLRNVARNSHYVENTFEQPAYGAQFLGSKKLSPPKAAKNSIYRI